MDEDSKEVFYGTVIWFGSSKGFGFVQQEGESKPDIFVYWSDINQPEGGFKTLQKDQRVSYEIGKNAKGQDKAINVTVIK